MYRREGRSGSDSDRVERGVDRTPKDVDVTSQVPDILTENETAKALAAITLLAQEAERAGNASRVALLKGMKTAGMPHIPTEQEIGGLEEKVRASGANSATDFAFTVGKNWAIDRRLRMESKERRDALQSAREVEDSKEALDEKMLREELREVIARLVQTITPSKIAQLMLVQLKLVDGYSDAVCERFFPNTSQDVRNKWMQRGRDALLTQDVSTGLRELLTSRSGFAGGAVTETPLRKYQSTNV